MDSSRAPIAGARIIALDNGNILAASAASDSDGNFSLSLTDGDYTVEVASDNFTAVAKPVKIPLSSADPFEFVLQVEAVHAVITVSDATGYQVESTASATRTLIPLRDVPQSITVVNRQLIQDKMMMSIGDVVQYVPGITAHQGENNRDQVIIRGNNSSADFFVNGVRDDVQYYRDLYNLDRVEALKGPNAAIFGRGGGGGVINRVTKEAGFTPLREFSLLGGSYGNKRFTADFDQPLNEKIAFRFNGLYENSDSFRNYVNLKRYGWNPTLTIVPGERTHIVVAYEHFRDDRVADRGITSFQGRPADVDIATYYGNPNDSHVGAGVNLGSVLVEHQFGRLILHNRTLVGDYDRGYQNFVPGIANAAGTQVALSAYNNATSRRNVFNQTDLTYAVRTGGIRHSLLGGVEAGRQLTDNFRNTGYFNNTATSIQVPFADPVINTPVTFRQSATDADNHLKTNLGAAYLQDQLDLFRHFQAIVGVRFDHFDLQYHNNRTGDNLRRIDNLVSPRVAIVYKPAPMVSIYTSYTVSYLPSSGDQFSSLTTITEQVKPEKFSNYEAGAKWDIRSNISLTTAVYRLDRTNTRSTDPNDPTRIVQTGAQRTNGFEIGWNGSVTSFWKVMGGYAYQDAFVVRATTAASAGVQVGQVPHHTFSFWNNYQIVRRLGAGFGVIHRADMFAAVDNTVTLPGYTRADAAVYFSLTERVRLQANVENVLDRRYYLNADGNTNISPDAPRAVRVGVVGRF
jgi:catecholate siderophore receptor